MLGTAMNSSLDLEIHAGMVYAMHAFELLWFHD